jgi:protein-tyrosine phosphatase
MHNILFLCTGNYYRSRFAEHLFNHLAQQRNLHWHASSRALAVELGAMNIGPMSRHTKAALIARGVPLPETSLRNPISVTDDDFRQADLIIALKEQEHRPMMEQRHPTWCSRTEYWHVHDLDQAPPQTALSEIEQLVKSLLDRLGS